MFDSHRNRTDDEKGWSVPLIATVPLSESEFCWDVDGKILLRWKKNVERSMWDIEKRSLAQAKLGSRCNGTRLV